MIEDVETFCPEFELPVFSERKLLLKKKIG